MPTTPFQQALESVERLPWEDQLSLVDIVQKRLIETRREEIARNAAVTLDAVERETALSAHSRI